MKRSIITTLSLVLFSIASVTPVYALSGTYTYPSSSGYYTEYGPAAYWHTKNSEGYCGHMSGSCSPSSMRWTYTSGCIGAVNYAKWDNTDSAQNGTESVFIPRVYATSRMAPYVMTYNGASSHTFTIDQYVYSNVWISAGTYYDIRNTWLDDNSCEAGTKQLGFDEIKISY